MQQEHFGFGKLKDLGKILKVTGVWRPLLVTGQASYATSGAQGIVEHALSGLRSPPRFSQFSINPKLPEAAHGCEVLRTEQCDSIVAIGGGSAIDMAKIINAISADPTNAEATAIGRRSISSHPLPLVAIPTTAGTGSEATHFAVVYVDGVKYSLADRQLLPDVVIVDPELTLTLPAYVTACSGFDALCQAVESYWAVGSSATSRAFSHTAFQLIVPNLRRAVEDPSSRPARLSMALAANLAGKAIDIAKTTSAHALSYPLTSLYSIPHGHAVALTLGKIFRLSTQCPSGRVSDPRGTSHVRRVMSELITLFGRESPEEFEERWYDYMRACGLESDPARLGVRSLQDRKAIVSGINLERLTNHPVRLTQEQLVWTLSRA